MYICIVLINKQKHLHAMSKLTFQILENKGLTVNVLRAARAGDGTNKGLSSKEDILTLVGVNADGTAFAPVFETKEDKDYLVITRRFLFGKWEVTAHPKSVLDSGKWAMFGGNFCFSSDSRFAELNGGAPIKIFDRVETKEQSDQMSF